MIVWIVNPYGSLQDEAWQEYRSSMLARALARAGHRAVWWISSFEHRSKRFRAEGWRRSELDERTSLVIVPTTPYRDHISVARIRSEQAFARHVVEQAPREPRPDVVVLAEPALFFGAPIVEWCGREGVRLVVDILDLWPELFRVVLPRPVRGMHRQLFAPLYARRRRLLRRADGIVAVCRDYLEPAREAGVGCPSEVCYLGIPPAREAASAGPVQGLPSRAADEVRFVYAGTFGEAYDLPTVARAATTLLDRGARCRFVFAGAGPLEPLVRRLAATHPGAVHFLGTLTPAQLREVYRDCDAGLCSYAPDSTVAMPVKLYDYLGAGLAVVNSLTRECGALVASSGCGLNYAAGDAGSLAATLQRCLDDPIALASFRAAARSLAPQFDADAQHDRFVRFIERVAG